MSRPARHKWCPRCQRLMRPLRELHKEASTAVAEAEKSALESGSVDLAQRRSYERGYLSSAMEHLARALACHARACEIVKAST